jgi:hypothetical protein
MQVELVRDENTTYLTEYHLPEFCFCDEELRYLYKCSACEVIVTRKSDTPPSYGDHFCNLGALRVSNQFYVKVGETFIKECKDEVYLRRK